MYNASSKQPIISGGTYNYDFIKLKMSSRVLKFIFAFSFLVSISDVHGANILFLFGGGNLSHKISIWPLVTGLAEKGHNVTFASSNEKQPRKHPNVIDVVPKAWKDYTAQLYNIDRLKDRIQDTHWTIRGGFYEKASTQFCGVTLDAIATDQTLQSIVHGGKYDLVIINSIFGECFFPLAYHLGAKHIVFDGTMFLPWFHGIYGVPMEPSWVPDFEAQETHPPGFMARVRTVIKYFRSYYRAVGFNEDMEALFNSKFPIPNLPSFIDLERNTSLVFINSHHSTDFARSLPPMMVNIGGMQCWDPVGTLPQTFQEYMDGAEDGVILISFGSTIQLSSLPKSLIDIFFNTMRKYSKVRFIWRWDGPMPEGHPDNIMASKWLPQREILDHSKTIGFMTHCGLNSINEATFHGVPLIALPLFADQDLSAYRIQAQEIGIKLEAKDLSQEVMDKAMGEIIFNPKYKKNMATRSKIFRDRPKSPAEEAVFWTEFVLRNDDTSALKPMLLDQSYWVRTSVDVYLAFIGIGIGLPLLVLYMVTKLVKLVY